MTHVNETDTIILERKRLTIRSLSVGRDRVTFGRVVVGRPTANASLRYH